jgi:hypothetical protein
LRGNIINLEFEGIKGGAQRLHLGVGAEARDFGFGRFSQEFGNGSSKIKIHGHGSHGGDEKNDRAEQYSEHKREVGVEEVARAKINSLIRTTKNLKGLGNEGTTRRIRSS